MSLPIQTVQFQEHNIRILGLPDEPVFILQDLLNVLKISKKEAALHLIPELEVFEAEPKTKACNYAGVFRLIFNSQDQPVAYELEKWFNQEMIPTLRKYGYPYSKSEN